MTTERKPDMLDDCRRLMDMREDRAAMVRELNALPARIAEQERRIEEVSCRIEARIEAKGRDAAATLRHDGRDYSLCLGARGELQVRESFSMFSFRDDALPAAVIAADAATDAPSADDDMHGAAAAFGIEVDMDDPISEAAFRMAMDDEIGPDGLDGLRSLACLPATDSEYRDALESGLISQPAVA